MTHLDAIRPVSEVAGDDGELDVSAHREQLLRPSQANRLAAVKGAVDQRLEDGARG